jgi:hypothetical protein
MKDRVQDYEFSYAVQGSIQNEDDWKVLEAYFEEAFVNESKVRHFHSTYNDAYYQAVAVYEQELATIDEDLILDCIKEKDDLIVLCGVISGDNVKETIKATYWNYEYKQKVRPDPAE